MLVKPLQQIFIDLFPVCFIEELMPVSCIQPESHILNTGCPVLLIDLADTFSEITYRVIRT